MGIEYTITLKPFDPAQIKDHLLQLPGAESSEEDATRIEYRLRPCTKDEMPDATAILGASSLYFCDHGGRGNEVLFAVLACLRETHEAVVPEEL